MGIKGGMEGIIKHQKCTIEMVHLWSSMVVRTKKRRLTRKCAHSGHIFMLECRGATEHKKAHVLHVWWHGVQERLLERHPNMKTCPWGCISMLGFKGDAEVGWIQKHVL